MKNKKGGLILTILLLLVVVGIGFVIYKYLDAGCFFRNIFRALEVCGK